MIDIESHLEWMEKKRRRKEERKKPKKYLRCYTCGGQLGTKGSFPYRYVGKNEDGERVYAHDGKCFAAAKRGVFQ